MSDPTRLIIATPTDGAPPFATVTWGYHNAVRQLERAGANIIPSEVCFADDLARARSRCVWWALQRDFDWLLFWDDDVVPKDTGIIPDMIDAAVRGRHSWLGAPYPRKRIPAAFPYKPLPGATRMPVVDGCVEVELLAIGFTLISRECLALMVGHYREADWFTDGHDADNPHETVGIFKQVTTATVTRPDGSRFRELYSEDYSACSRWRAMAGRIQMYVGPGSPVAHVGMHSFEGMPSELGNAR